MTSLLRAAHIPAPAAIDEAIVTVIGLLEGTRVVARARDLVIVDAAPGDTEQQTRTRTSGARIAAHRSAQMATLQMRTVTESAEGDLDQALGTRMEEHAKTKTRVEDAPPADGTSTQTAEIIGIVMTIET